MVNFEDKTRDELERNLVEAYERLVRAGRAFDAGHRSEAPNIAKEVYSLIDRTKGRALLKHLGLADVPFVSTASAMTPGNCCPEYRLLWAAIGFDGMDYRPRLSEGPDAALAFDAWCGEVVLAFRGQEDIRRYELVEFIRHVEGGGHVGARYEPRWSGKMMGLMRGDYIDGHMELNGGPPVVPEPHAPAYATVRQIGWEIEETLRRACPVLVARAELRPVPGPKMRPLAPRA